MEEVGRLGRQARGGEQQGGEKRGEGLRRGPWAGEGVSEQAEWEQPKGLAWVAGCYGCLRGCWGSVSAQGQEWWGRQLEERQVSRLEPVASQALCGALAQGLTAQTGGSEDSRVL